MKKKKICGAYAIYQTKGEGCTLDPGHDGNHTGDHLDLVDPDAHASILMTWKDKPISKSTFKKFDDLGKWERRWFERAIVSGTWSKDEKHKIGSLIVNDDNIELSGGFNGFPRGVKDDDRLLYKNRDIKNRIIIHAEANAICAAARVGHALLGGIAFCTQPPCSQCAGMLIQVGVKKVYFFSNTTTHWGESIQIAKDILDEAQVPWVEVESIIEVDRTLTV